MLRYRIVPVIGHPPHTHGIVVDDNTSLLDGMVAVYNRATFMGEDDRGFARLFFDYTIITPPATKVPDALVKAELAEIMHHLLDTSDEIADQELSEKQRRAEQLEAGPAVDTLEDGSTVEVFELPLLEADAS
jgi:hypothetical protein